MTLDVTVHQDLQENVVKRRLIYAYLSLASTELVLIAYITMNVSVIQDGLVLHVISTLMTAQLSHVRTTVSVLIWSMDINVIAKLDIQARIVNIQLMIVKAIHVKTVPHVLINLKALHANVDLDLLDFNVRLKSMNA